MKSVPRLLPGLDQARHRAEEGRDDHPRARPRPATLVYLAGQNVVTAHTWLSRADKPRPAGPADHRLRSVPGDDFAEVRAAARDAGERLRDAGLVPFAMVTGSRGIHVVCPLRRGPDFSEVHGFARTLAEAMVADDPRHLTLEWHGRARRAHLRRREPDRLRPARGRAVRRQAAPAGAGGDAAPLGGAVRRKLRPDRWTIRTSAIDSTPRATRGPGSRARPGPRLPS